VRIETEKIGVDDARGDALRAQIWRPLPPIRDLLRRPISSSPSVSGSLLRIERLLERGRAGEKYACPATGVEHAVSGLAETQTQDEIGAAGRCKNAPSDGAPR